MMTAGAWRFFASEETHVKRQLCRDIGSGGIGRRALPFQPDVLDFFVVVAPRDQGRNGDDKAHQRGVKGDGNTFGEGGVIADALAAKGGEEGDQTVESAHETGEWRDADDDFQNYEAALELHDFMARAGFDRVDIFLLRPIEMIAGGQ